MPAMEKLHRNNFTSWSCQVRAVLDQNQLLRFIECDVDTVNNLLETPDGRRDNAIAMAIIAARVKRSIYGNLVDQCSNAREMWQLLSQHSNKLSHDQPDAVSGVDSIHVEGKTISEQLHHTLQYLEKVEKLTQGQKDQIANELSACQLCTAKTHVATDCWRLKDLKKDINKKVKNKPIIRQSACSIA